jgi:DinB family protein
MIDPRMCLAIGLACAVAVPAIHGQPRQPPDAMKAITGTFNSVHNNILEMAEDFPADKYGFKPKPEMRSFGEVIVHVFSGTTYAAKAGKGEAAQWTELDPKNYADKAAVVAGIKKAIAEADATLKATPATRFAASPEPWLSVIEHSAEHYGLLVAYYRLNGLVPPASRPKK